MGRAFPPHPGCPVPSVSAITGVLVSSCKVDPPADPIFSFPIFATPLPNPPSFNFGCYKPTVRATVHLNQVIPHFSPTVRFPRSSDTGTCQPEFDFDIAFPASNCPDISASGKIHLLPPRTSPSLSLTVHKNSDNCSFKFKLSVGVPGGQCTSIDTNEIDQPDRNLDNGDSFFVDDNFSFRTDGTDDQGCQLWIMDFDNTKFTLDLTLDTAAHNIPGFPECCTDFFVVASIDGWTYPGAVGGVGGLPTLNYSTRQIYLPTWTLEPPTGPLPKTIPCGGTFHAIVDLGELVPDDLHPCCPALTPSLNAYTITPPGFAVSEPTDDGLKNLIDGPVTVLESIDDSGSTTCSFNVSSKSIQIGAGGISCDITLVCDISCSGSSLVVSKVTLSFSNGILASSTGDCACA